MQEKLKEHIETYRNLLDRKQSTMQPYKDKLKELNMLELAEIQSLEAEMNIIKRIINDLESIEGNNSSIEPWH